MDFAMRITVGNRLKEVRQRQQLALYGLAALSGVSPTTLCAIEKWDYCPRDEVRRRIAVALRVDVTAIWPVGEVEG
jgi:DNA-binding XRE family transcriptional regulator